jgi:hypothetical protein
MVEVAIIRNLLSVRQFTRNNSCSIEFDACGFSVKDLWTRRVILRCNSDGGLYTLPSSTLAATTHALITASSMLWHVGGTRKIRNTTLTKVKVLNTFNSTVRAQND